MNLDSFVRFRVTNLYRFGICHLRADESNRFGNLSDSGLTNLYRVVRFVTSSCDDESDRFVTAG